MKALKGRVAIVTGASRGIGVHIGRALATRGVHLVLAARSEPALREVQAELSETYGVDTLVVATDVCDAEARAHLVAAALERFDRVDILVNNAALESSSRYQHMDPERIQSYIDLNLSAPMLLTREVLPHMLERGEGHIVNMGSLAGLGPNAFGEAYGATKHGIVGFTRALRASLQCQKSQVSASVINPGYVRDTGMFHDKAESYAVSAPGALGTSSPEQVARAVLRAIERDLPDVVVNRGPIRLMLTIGLLAPRFSEWVSHRLGVHGASAEAAQRGLQDGS